MNNSSRVNTTDKDAKNSETQPGMKSHISMNHGSQIERPNTIERYKRLAMQPIEEMENIPKALHELNCQQKHNVQIGWNIGNKEIKRGSRS